MGPSTLEPRFPRPTQTSETAEEINHMADQVLPIFNLANAQLTATQISVLTKGLSFVPSDNTDWYNTEMEIRRFLRTVRLRTFFKEHVTNEDPNDTGLHPKSSFSPSENQVPSDLLTFERCVLRDLRSLSKRKHNHRQQNITRAEREGLYELAKKSELVIKPADKGGGIVIMKSEQYFQMVMDLLKDTQSYKLLKKDPTKDLKVEISEMVSFALERDWITEKESDFLNTTGGRTPCLYALPKIHKNSNNPPGRPIVSGCGSILEPLCKFVDHFLKPISITTESYIRDTMHTIQMFENLAFDPQKNVLVTFDIKSLYTSIPQQAAIDCVYEYLVETNRETKAPPEFIIELMTLALCKNFFEFDKQFYLQIKGTAMGAAFAPSLAILFMAKFEKNFIYNTINPWKDNIKQWRRYIDDVICLWEGTEHTLQNFFVWLNTCSIDIQFTMECSHTRINFLDLTIGHNQGRLTCNTFRKPTDHNTLLHFQSDHPKHIKENLPYGQFLRLRRNCTDLHDFYHDAELLSNRLIERGYPRKLVSRSLKRARFTCRDSLLTPKTRVESQDQITCVITHGQHAFQVKQIIHKYWPIARLCLPDQQSPRFAFKRARNIREHLVHSLYTKRPPQSNLWNLRPLKGHHPCGSCSVCQFTSKIQHFQVGYKTWTLKDISNCKTTQVVYCIECPCKLRYVGQTTRSVGTRISEHRSRIRCKNLTSPLVQHYMDKKHTTQDIKWWVLERVRNGPNIQGRLLDLESRWIHRLDSVQQGLNEQQIFPY
ncbi:uncharacterized protein [Ambystoma mexicanum]|uniref:uncharacterized protein n=1 Tax=Ambystoma mexicanum TaxID=8296 RepID=UPI0037E980CC